MAFVGYNGGSANEFYFVLLNNVQSGTQISFSNDCYDAAGSALTTTCSGLGNGKTADVTTWVADQDYPAGTQITYNGGSNPGSFSPGDISITTDSSALGLKAGGFILSAFQGTASDLTPVAAILAGGLWGSSNPLPWGLADGASALAITSTSSSKDPVEYGAYDCADTADNEEDLQAAINGYGVSGSGNPLNWTFQDNAQGSLSAYLCPSYSVTGAWTSTPTLTVSPTETASPNPSATATPTGTATPTCDMTPSATPAGTATPTCDMTGSPTPAGTATLTCDMTGSATPTGTATPTCDMTGSPTPTGTATPTGTPATPPTVTAGPTATGTPTPASGTTFNPGDLAFVAFSGGQNEFSLVLLQPMESGTVLDFTNDGWASSTALQSSAKVIQFTSSSSYPAGTVLTYYGDLTSPNALGAVSATAANGTVTDAGTASLTSVSGKDTALGVRSSAPLVLGIFQGTTTSPVAVTMMLDGAAWGTTSGGNCPCYLPSNLTDGTTAWSTTAANYPASAGAYYDCALASGTETELDDAINADENATQLRNWTDSADYAASNLCAYAVGQTPTDTTTSTPAPTVNGTFTDSPTASPTSTVSPFETPTPSFTAPPTPTVTPTPQPGTVFNAGDLAFVAFSSDSKGVAQKQFTLMLLQPMNENTVLYFTNDGWGNGGSGGVGTSVAGDKTVEFTSTSAYAAGTLLTYYDDATTESKFGAVSATADGVVTNAGTVVAANSETTSDGDGLGVSTTAPLVLSVFQGTTASPTAITAMLDGAAWPVTYTANNCPCYLPGGLTDGQDAWSSPKDYLEGGYYDCEVSGGSEESVDAAVNDDAGGALQNWIATETYTLSEICGSAGGSIVATPAPGVPAPLVGPVPQTPGGDVYFQPAKPSTGSQYWVYNLMGRLVSTLDFGACDGTSVGEGCTPYWRADAAPGVYRVKAVVHYDDGSTYSGWLTVAIVP